MFTGSRSERYQSAIAVSGMEQFFFRTPFMGFGIDNDFWFALFVKPKTSMTLKHKPCRCWHRIQFSIYENIHHYYLFHYKLIGASG